VEHAELKYGERIGVGNFAEVYEGTLRGKQVVYVYLIAGRLCIFV
jgi:hypothetical protein